MTTEKEEEFLNACFLGKTKKAKELIKDGVNIEVRDKWGYTSLMWASWKNRKDTVQILIDAGADVNAIGRWGNTALMLACRYGHKDIVQILIDAGADIEAKKIYGLTPLLQARSSRNKEIVKLLKLKIKEKKHDNKKRRRVFSGLFLRKHRKS